MRVEEWIDDRQAHGKYTFLRGGCRHGRRALGGSR